MEFPFGGHHNRHHHHHHRNEEEEEEEYPPPPSYHHHHQPPSFGTTIESHQHYGPPPPNYMYEQDDMYQRPPPPPQPDFSGYNPSGVYSSPVQHVSHDFNHNQQRFEPEDPSGFRHHHHHTLLHHHNPNDQSPPTSFVYQHTHETGVGGNELFNNSNVPTVRVYSKAEPGYSLTIRDGRVILAPSDPTDVFQHWIKDEKYSVRVKDEEGFPSFSLVNKATGQAIKHSIGATHPVQLRPYNPDDLDESVLWTESRDLGDGFRTIRMVNNIRLNLDAFHGDINHGGVHDGTTIVLWEWKKGDNQRWRIVRYCKSFNTPIKKGI